MKLEIDVSKYEDEITVGVLKECYRVLSDRHLFNDPQSRLYHSAIGVVLEYFGETPSVENVQFPESTGSFDIVEP